MFFEDAQEYTYLFFNLHNFHFTGKSQLLVIVSHGVTLLQSNECILMEQLHLQPLVCHYFLSIVSLYDGLHKNVVSVVILFSRP